MSTTTTTWDMVRTSTAGAPYGDLHSTQVMEQYSVAFLHAIATRARCKLEHLKVDDEQVDVTLRQKANHLKFQRTMIDVQIKCTGQAVVQADGVHFSIQRSQYEGLKEKAYLQKILIVVAVDPDFDQWMDLSPTDILMRGQAFWISTAAMPELAANVQSQTVVLPLANEFNVDQLLDMLKRVGDGDEL